MSQQWYYRRGADVFGPITSAQLKSFAASGQLRPDDLVKVAGTEKWLAAAKVQRLFDATPPAAPAGPQPPPLPRRAKPVPPPLPPAGGRNPPPLPATRPAFPHAPALGRLTAYAKSVPHHDFKDFGAEVKVERTAVLTVYRIEWTTLFERRELADRERQHDGGQHPPLSVTAGRFDPWSVSLAVSDLDPRTTETPVPGSSAVVGCRTCGTVGQVQCGGCGGQTVVACGSCEGHGAVRCRSCLGLGRVMNQVPQQRQRRCGCDQSNGRFTTIGACSLCGNTGLATYTHYEAVWVQCLACQASGQQTCVPCGGCGRVQCPTCTGAGIVFCGSCAGSGRVVHFLAIVQTLEADDWESVACPGGCPSGVVDRLDTRKDFGELVTRTAIGGSVVGLGDCGFPEHVLATAEELRSTAAARADADRRHAGERVRVLSAPVYRLDYTFRGKRYVAWLPGDDRPVYAPASPLTERTSELISDALVACDEGNRRATLRSLRMALDMGKKCEDCRAVVVQHRSSIPDDLYEEAGKFDLLNWLGNLFR